MQAKVGDKIEPAARKRLAKAMGGRLTAEDMPTEVSPKTDGSQGQWFCVTCGELPQNNMQCWGHQDDKPMHKMAWRSHDSGKIEEP